MSTLCPECQGRGEVRYDRGSPWPCQKCGGSGTWIEQVAGLEDRVAKLEREVSDMKKRELQRSQTEPFV